jgi:Uma2 family endonuclease
MAPTATVSHEEYLHREKYKHSEYLDGVIRDKLPMVNGVPLVSNLHGGVVTLIAEWFGKHKQEWRVKCGTEVTTFISPTRCRLPDVSVIPFGPMDEYQVKPPLIAIEVLSPSNTRREMLNKWEDYDRMGIPNVWVIDPETRTGLVRQDGELTPVMRFEVPGTPIYMDVSRLFAQFDEENQPLDH